MYIKINNVKNRKKICIRSKSNMSCE